MAIVTLGTKPILKTSIKAAADLTKRRFIDFAGNHCAVGEASLGVLIHDTKTGKLGTVIAIGIAEIEAGGALSVGDAVVSDANGKAVVAAALDAVIDTGGTTVTSTSANGDIITPSGSVTPEIILGRVLDAASNDADVVRVLLVKS